MTLIFGFGGFVAVPLGLINIAEAVIAASLLRRFFPAIGEFRSTTEVGSLVLAGGVVAPAVTAFAGAACAVAAHRYELLVELD